jgi:hypothetical protein
MALTSKVLGTSGGLGAWARTSAVDASAKSASHPENTFRFAIDEPSS